MRLICFIFILAIFQGCSTQHKLNSNEQLQKVNAAYESECKNAGGVIGQPVEVGSFGTCDLKNKKVDMYIHAVGLFFSRFISPDEKESPIIDSFKDTCVKYNGKLLFKTQFFCEGVDVSGNKWLASLKIDHEPNRGRAGVVTLVRIPEGKKNEGSVYPFLWDFVFKTLF